MRADDPLLLTLKVFHEVKRVLLCFGGSKLATELSFNPAQEVKLGVGWLKDAVAGCFGYLVLFQR